MIPDRGGHSTLTATSRPESCRLSVWLPALKAANLEIHVRLHDLRHAHASWLLAGGADLQVVKRRLRPRKPTDDGAPGHTLPDADETALEALSKIRNRTRSGLEGTASGT